MPAPPPIDPRFHRDFDDTVEAPRSHRHARREASGGALPDAPVSSSIDACPARESPPGLPSIEAPPAWTPPPATSPSPPLPAFAELHCVSNFSFLRGASHAEELVERAVRLGYSALAITDECSVAGVVRAHQAAKTHGLPLIVGTEVTLVDDPADASRTAGLATTAVNVTARAAAAAAATETARAVSTSSTPQGPRLVLLATDRASYARLARLISTGRRQADKGSYRLAVDDLDDGLPGCLVLWAPHAAQVDAGVLPRSTVAWLASRFAGRVWIAAGLFRDGRDAARRATLAAWSQACGLPCVAANDVHMHTRGRRVLQDVLVATRLRTTVAHAGFALFPNGERHLRSRARLAQLYPAAWLAESVAIARRCTFSLDALRYEYPDEVVPRGHTPTSWLRALVQAGIAWRFFGGAPPWQVHGDAATLVATDLQAIDTDASLADPARLADAPPGVTAALAQIAHELALITELRYEAYFLTVYDVVRFARTAGILCQGRGSAANSAVCYVLGITEVDPARMSMLFERFISKERNEPPDIDVDFEHQRREEVIQYLYAKYGRERAALTATVICYRPRSAFRDAGRALGFDTSQLERVSDSLSLWDRGAAVVQRLREAGFDPDNRVMRRVTELAFTLLGFPRHLSQHTGGFVLSRGPLVELVPVENAAMPERTVIQWDKDDLDAVGLMKVDVLALGMLSAIRRALEHVSASLGRPFGMHDIPPEDPVVYDMLCEADTIGVFQIESRAQMTMLPRLRPRRFYDLVVEVAIVRPGPIQGGMVHPYLKRRQGLEPVTYPSPEVERVLERTLGVPIFQEQVMQLAVVAAGFSPGEADGLRRSMAAWRRKGGLEPYERRLKDGMAARGYDPRFAEQIYQQILGFGEYGFPESHAASFSLLVYVSAWLKRHHPAAFCAGLLNSQPMGFYSASQLVQDAQRHGVEVRPVDARVSDVCCSLERGAGAPTGGCDRAGEHKPVLAMEASTRSCRTGSLERGAGAESPPALRLGLCLVKGLSQAGAERLVAARAQPFAHFEQLARRAQLDRGDLDALARAGALASLEGHRHAASWTVAGFDPSPLPLFVDTFAGEPQPRGATLPLALTVPTEGQDLVADYASTGLTLGRHPLALLRPQLRRRRTLTARELALATPGRRVRACGIVTCRQRPGTASGVIFVTLEDETGHANIVVWRDVGERQRRTLLGARLLAVTGPLQREAGVTHVIAERLEDLTSMLGSLVTESRDFH